MKKFGVIFLAALAAVLLLYGKTLAFPFLELDDPKHIFENPQMHPVSWQNTLKFWKQPYFGMWIPVTYTVWSGLYAISTDPVIFHAWNLLLHALNVTLLFFLLEAFVSGSYAAIAALIFAFHPVQVEAVAWISGGKDLLSTTLVLVAMVLCEKRRMAPAMPGFALSVLAKPATLFFPFLSYRRKYRVLLAWFGFAAFVVGLTLRSQAETPSLTPIPWWERPIYTLDAVGFYLRKIFWPTQFGIDYGRMPGIAFSAVNAALGVLVLGGFIWAAARKNRAVTTAGFWIGAALLPVSGLFTFQFQQFSTVADRYLYLAMSGVALLVGLSLAKWQRQNWGLGPILVLGLALLSYRELDHWRNSEALFRHALAVNPHSRLAQTNLAFTLAQQHHYAEASFYLGRAVSEEPGSADLRVNYGAALARAGQMEAALSEFERAIALSPRNAAAHSNLQKLLRHKNQRTQTRLRP